MDLSFITLLIASVYAQGPGCSIGNNIPAFQACARDALVDTVGQVGPTDIHMACDSLKSDQGSYYRCLCERSNSLVGCYSIFCPADPILASSKQSQIQYCEAAKQFPVSTVAVKTPTQGSPTDKTAAATESATDADNSKKNSGSILLIVPGIIAFTIGLMI
jgi:hypothetical protein